MKNNLYSLIRYLRVNQDEKLECLAKKLGISKSHMSLLERDLKKLYLDDFVNALKYLGCKIKILNEDGEDCMMKMNNEVIKKELNLTDCGYSKDYISKNNEPIRVEFDTLTGKVVVAKDMKDTTKYLSEEKYSLYQEKYDENSDGYGLFFREYYDSFDGHWEMLMKLKDKSNEIDVSDKAYEVFDENVVGEIKNTFVVLWKYK